MAGRGRSFKRRGNPASIFTQKKKREEDEAKKTIFDIPDIPHNTEECDSDSEIYEVPSDETPRDVGIGPGTSRWEIFHIDNTVGQPGDPVIRICHVRERVQVENNLVATNVWNVSRTGRGISRREPPILIPDSDSDDSSSFEDGAARIRSFSETDASHSEDNAGASEGNAGVFEDNVGVFEDNAGASEDDSGISEEDSSGFEQDSSSECSTSAFEDEASDLSDDINAIEPDENTRDELNSPAAMSSCMEEDTPGTSQNCQRQITKVLGKPPLPPNAKQKLERIRQERTKKEVEKSPQQCLPPERVQSLTNILLLNKSIRRHGSRPLILLGSPNSPLLKRDAKPRKPSIFQRIKSFFTSKKETAPSNRIDIQQPAAGQNALRMDGIGRRRNFQMFNRRTPFNQPIISNRVDRMLAKIESSKYSP